MSVFFHQFSEGMSPSIDEITSREFQNAHGLVHDLLNARGRLSDENIEEVAKKCFREVSESFSERTWTRHCEAVSQYIANAEDVLTELCEEIRATSAAATAVIGNIYPSKAPSTPTYDALLEALGGLKRADEIYFRLSPSACTTLHRWAEHKELSDILDKKLPELCTTFNLAHPHEIALFFNKLSERYNHIRSFPRPIPPYESLAIASATMGMDPMIKKVYRDEDPDEMWKKLLIPAAIEALPLGKGSDFLPLILSNGSAARFNAFNKIPAGILEDVEDVQGISTTAATLTAFSDHELFAVATLFSRLDQCQRDVIDLFRPSVRSSLLRLWIEDRKLIKYMRYIAEHPEDAKDEHVDAAVDWYLWFTLQIPEANRVVYRGQPLHSSFPWTQQQIGQIISYYNGIIDWGRFRR